MQKFILTTLLLILIGELTFSQTSKESNALGDRFFNLSQFKEAINQYSRVILLDPTNSYAFYMRGQSFYKLENDVNAVLDYNNAISLDSTNINYYYMRGQSLGYLGKISEAINDYNKVISIDSSFKEPYVAKGRLFLSSNKLDSAVNCYSIAINLDGSPDLYFSRGYSFQLLNSYEEALSDYKFAIELDSSYTSAYLNSGNIYVAISDFKNALKYFDKALKIEPKNGQLYYARAFAHYRDFDIENACRDWQQSLDLDFELARSYVDANCNKVARQYDSTNYYIQKSNSLPKEMHEQKIEYLDKGIEISKRQDNGTISGIMQNRINEYIALKKYGLAEKDYLYLIKQHERKPIHDIGGVYNGLANLYRDTKKYSKAVGFYDKAVVSTSIVAKHLFYLGYAKCLVEMKKYDEAIEKVNLGLVSIAKDDPNVIKIEYYKSKTNTPAEYFILMYQRAIFYLKAGKKTEACTDLETILSLDPNSDVFKIQSQAKDLQNEECK